MKPHHARDARRPAHARAFALLLAAALPLAGANAAHAERVTPPRVPAGLEPEAGSEPFLVGHASGTQNYVCLPSGAGFGWILYQPEATLFDQRGKQLTTHFFRPNPFEDGLFRPAWQHSRDTSTVWGRLHASSSDAAYVAPGAIPWLLIDVAGAAAGPRGGDALARATQIQRVHTTGGAAPGGGCAAPGDVGKRAFVPYTADYYFYAQPDEHRGED